MTISFFVAGSPRPQGSKRAIMRPGQRHPSVVESASQPLKDWRACVAHEATAHVPPRSGPVKVRLVFFLTRPKADYGSGRNAGKLKAAAPDCHTQSPDVDKLTRAVLDALSGRVYADDRQVVEVQAEKRWQPRGLLPSSLQAYKTLLPTLERLCSMKQRVMLTDHQTETWLAVLSQFPVKAVNRAVLQLGLSADPFPDLGKLVLLCQRFATEGQYAPGRDPDRVSDSTMKAMARALRLEV
ncbi:MAG: RusA family crossover junction endodeoxyribonuclease [Fuerstiella sp.]